MNRRCRRTSHSILACSFVLLLACSAFAQKPLRSGTADIPFDFYIAGNKLPAGHYTLDLVAPTYVTIRSQDGKLQQDLYFLQAAVATKGMPTQLVFAVRDGKYYLAEIWSDLGKSQLTSFSSKAGEKTKDVPLTITEKSVAKP
jgi:hypothetical protein